MTERVGFTLYEGSVPESGACIEIAVLKGVVVRLDAPLGDREVRAGAA